MRRFLVCVCVAGWAAGCGSSGDPASEGGASGSGGTGASGGAVATGAGGTSGAGAGGNGGSVAIAGGGGAGATGIGGSIGVGGSSGTGVGGSAGTGVGGSAGSGGADVGGGGGASGGAGQIPPAGGAALEAWLAGGAYLSWHCESAPHPAKPPSAHVGNRICSNELAVAWAGQGERPSGSASVKELYDTGLTKIVGYAVATKLDSTSAGGASWYWYERVGTSVYADGKAKTLCTGCHSGAGSDAATTTSAHSGDFIFTQVE